jgi:hypothetical protein
MAGKTIRFLGDGTEAHFGIPARDLDAAAFAALSDEQQATVKASRLYDYAAIVPVQETPLLAEEKPKK